MKHGLKPNKREKIAMKASGLTPEKWLIFKKTHDTLHVIHRETGSIKTILA